MRIAVLGAGNGGCAVSADLSLRGHEVTLIKTSRSIHNDNFQFLVEHRGEIRLHENGGERVARISRVTTDLSELSQAEVIIIYIQTNFHEDLVKRIANHIKDGQIILFNPGYLSTAYWLKHSQGQQITIAEAQSSFIDCRITEPGLIKVGFRNVRNPVGIYPRRNQQLAKEKLEALGFPLAYLSSVMEAALHNPNLIVHTVGAVMSIPRIEKTKGDYTMYHEVFTPSVMNILEKLDAEKMDVLASYGFARLSYLEACKIRNTLDDSLNARDVFFSYAAMSTRAKGPERVDSRYITEDVPQGLVLLESLAQTRNIKTPVCTALIELADAALQRDFRRDGRTPQRLGEQNIENILIDR